MEGDGSGDEECDHCGRTGHIDEEGGLIIYVEDREIIMETGFDLDAIVTIVCPQHGDFTIKAGDHIGENVERIAYGCPKCDDNKVL